MFLSNLNMNEKKMFICLAKKAVEVNGEVSYEESDYLRLYCQEMSLDMECLGDDIKIDDIIETFKESEDSHKRIVIFETVSLMYADGLFDDIEKQYTNEFAERIGLNCNVVEDIFASVKKYVDCLTEISSLVLI